MGVRESDRIKGSLEPVDMLFETEKAPFVSRNDLIDAVPEEEASVHDTYPGAIQSQIATIQVARRVGQIGVVHDVRWGVVSLNGVDVSDVFRRPQPSASAGLMPVSIDKAERGGFLLIIRRFVKKHRCNLRVI